MIGIKGQDTNSMKTKLAKLIEERKREKKSLDLEREKHRRMNTCSVCDSPKGHTDLEAYKRQTSIALNE